MFTKEQLSISKKNRLKTRKLLNVPKGYDLHHKNPSLRHNNIDRYIQWLPEDVEILSHKDHFNLHMRSRSIDKSRNYIENSRFKNKKKVVCVDTGIVYNSTIEAEARTGISFQNISAVCRGIRLTAGGYTWRYF